MCTKKVKIGSFLKRRKDPIEIQDSMEYKRITIKTKHQGVFIRDKVKGVLIGTKLQFSVERGQFLLSKIDARLGAFGIVPEELEAGIITGNFWAFDVNKNKVNIHWFNLFTSSGNFYEICNRASSGTTHRKYLDETKFLNFEIDLPNLDEQNHLVKKHFFYNRSFKKLTSEIESQQIYLQQLRQAILQEAVQGKLTRQYPTDESASNLLQRVKAEKHRIIETGRQKKDNKIPPFTDAEMAFELPEGWQWCRLGEIGEIAGGIQKTPLRAPRKNIYPYLRVANVQRGFLALDEIEYFELENSELEKWKLKEGDLLIVEGNGSPNEIGRCAIWHNEISNCVHQNHLIRFRVHHEISSELVMIFINSPFGKSEMKSVAFTTTGLYTLSVSKISNLIFPLPPTAEQSRIVGKVKRLMQMVEQINQQIDYSQTQAKQLLQTVLKAAFGSKEYVHEDEIIKMAVEE